MRKRLRHQRWSALGVASLAGVLGLSVAAVTPSIANASATKAKASTKSDTIYLSDAWVGNSWRAQALSSWTQAAKEAERSHLLSSAPEVTANNSLATQASQLQSLILKHPAAIAIDAASETALNGAIAKACAAGIVVVAYDSNVSAPCAYKLENNFVQFGVLGAEQIAQQLHGKGNVLEVGGIAGNPIDQQVHQGWNEVLKRYPGIKVVSYVYGQSVEATAQSAVASVLPSLPQVKGVLGLGDVGLGIYNAFKDAGRPIPLTTFGNSSPELGLWSKLSKQKGGYSSIAIDTMPGESTAAMWLALYILSGHKVPKVIPMPFLTIKQSSLSKWLAKTPSGGFASISFNENFVVSLAKAAQEHKAPPAIPVPA